jgi:N4-(beta-N-acetylglucosaminyl)-L-asparaginase
MSISRRDFLGAGAAAAAGLTIPRSAGALPLISVTDRAPTITTTASRPVVIASANGIRGVAKAYEMITGGSDTLDAIVEGVKIQELDPSDQSVGLGGLPNENGVVQLDASCMHGPTKRAGAVACLEDIATPSMVAKAVMDYTDHILLVGPDAKRFALQMGFKEQNLLTEPSRQAWLRWKASRGGPYNWLVPPPAGMRPRCTGAPCRRGWSWSTPTGGPGRRRPGRRGPSSWSWTTPSSGWMSGGTSISAW